MERKYLRTLSRYLRLPRKTRKRILADLKAEIESRQENGEMIEEILKDLGPEKELAEEFHGNFEEQVFSRNEKAKMFDLTILGVLLLALAVYHGIPLAAPWLAAKYVLSGINKCSGKYTDFHGISIGGKGNPNKAGNRINGRSSHAAVGNPKKEKETVDVMPAGFSPSLFPLPTHQLICLNSGCRASKSPRLFQRGHRIRRL